MCFSLPSSPKSACRCGFARALFVVTALNRKTLQLKARYKSGCLLRFRQVISREWGVQFLILITNNTHANPHSIVRTRKHISFQLTNKWLLCPVCNLLDIMTYLCNTPVYCTVASCGPFTVLGTWEAIVTHD